MTTEVEKYDREWLTKTTHKYIWQLTMTKNKITEITDNEKYAKDKKNTQKTHKILCATKLSDLLGLLETFLYNESPVRFLFVRMNL